MMFLLAKCQGEIGAGSKGFRSKTGHFTLPGQARLGRSILEAANPMTVYIESCESVLTAE